MSGGAFLPIRLETKSFHLCVAAAREPLRRAERPPLLRSHASPLTRGDLASNGDMKERLRVGTGDRGWGTEDGGQGTSACGEEGN